MPGLGVISIFIGVVGPSGDGVASTEPTRQIDVGASPRAERPTFGLGRHAANRAFPATLGLGLIHDVHHAHLFRLGLSGLQPIEMDRKAFPDKHCDDFGQGQAYDIRIGAN